MKKIFLGLILVLCLLLGAPVSKAAQDKFGSNFQDDYLTKDANQDFKQTLQTTPVLPPVSQTIPPSLPTAQPNTPSLTSPEPIAPPLKNIADIKKLNISVPDFEKKYKELFEAEQIKKNKKKKNLMESILDEVIRYGILITLALVVFVVIYTIKKDRDLTPQAPPVETGKEKEQKTEEKKDIWKEDF